MQFLSRFSSSKSKDPSSSKAHRRHSTPPPSTQSASYLPLDLPSSSFLRDDSLSVPFGISPKPSRTQLISSGEEYGLIASGSSRSVDTQPWVEIQGGQGGGGSPRVGQQSEEEVKRGRKEDPVRVRKECVRLEKARIGVEQMITLMDECGETIRSRGLTTLGIFRPYRSSESLPQIRKLSLLFLDYSSEFLTAANPRTSSTRGTEASKTVKLHRFKEELRFAEIHDLVSVLKWGLRHFSPDSSFSLAPSSSAFEFYRSFLSATSRGSYPHTSFSTHLLPLLPLHSQQLLISTLTTIQAIAAYAEQNAMTSRRLCRLIGYYLFAPPYQLPDESWEGLYESWRESGMVLEGLLKAFLWEQDDLPPRLQELVNDFGRFVERSLTGDPDAGLGGRKVRVLRVEVVHRGEGWRRVGGDGEGVNDQETGYLVGGQRDGRYARRKPVEIMLDAFEASLEGKEGEEVETWRIVREKGRGEGWKEVLDDETVRVFDLLGLSTTSPDLPTAPSPRRHQSDASPFRLSPLEESPPSGSPSFNNFPNRSVTHLSPQEQQKRVVTPSWNDFTQKGFSNGTPDNLSNEFGQFSSGSSSSQEKIARRTAPKRGESKIVKINWMEIDEEFSDVWLDTLIESTTTSSPVSSWPSILVAPFRPSLLSTLPLESSSQQHLHLFIYEKLLPLVDAPPPPPAPVLQRNQSSASRKGRNDSSETSSLNPRKWTKRASSIFGSKREPSTESSPTMGSLGGMKSKKQSRKSMVIPDLPPPIPIISNLPRRSSMDPASTSPQPYSTSPSEGNVITRTISKTIARRKSKNSIISSPTEEKDRQPSYSSSPKFEAELVGAPVPAIPAKYSMEAVEAKRRSQASPVIATKSLEEETVVEEKPIKESAVPLVPQQVAPPSPETPLKEVLLQGQPILGGVNAALLNPSLSTENAIPLADSPTISRAAAIRTPSSESGSLLLQPIATPINDISSTSGEESEVLSTPAPIESKPIEAVASPTFTLSPPGGEPETLPSTVEDDIREFEPVTEPDAKTDSIERSEPVKEATNLGLGLSNVEEPPVEQPEIVHSREESIPSSPPQQESTTPASPSLLATPSSTTTHSPIDAEVGQDSPTIPVSPTPSSTSQGSTSKKFLARTRSFLTRKKSSSKLDQEREKVSKAEAKEQKELRRIQEDKSRNGSKKELQAPTPVSSVKKRVAELNQIANTNGSPNSITPSTSTSRFGKASSPTPASPSPLPSSNLPQSGSAASSIVPLPPVDAPQHTMIEEEEEEKTSVLQPEHAAPEVVKEIEEEEFATEFGSTSTEEPPFARSSTEILETRPDSTIPSLVIDEPPAQEAEHLELTAPSALEDLPSSLPSPTPQSDLVGETPLLVSEADTPSHSELPEEGMVDSSENQQDAPTQEASHLAVKIPSPLEDLPSPIPSPSPLPDDHTSVEPLTNEPEDSGTTEAIIPIPPTFASPDPTQDIGDLHQRDPSSSATVVTDQDEVDATMNQSHLSNGAVPRTPSKQNEPHDPSTLVTPTAPTPPIFHSSPSSPQPRSDDPFIDSTPVKPSTTAAAPPLVSSQSNFSISTRNSTDTFETAAAPSTATSANASAASSIHHNE